MKKLKLAILFLALTTISSCNMPGCNNKEEKKDTPPVIKQDPPADPPKPKPKKWDGIKDKADLIKVLKDLTYGDEALQLLADNPTFDPHLICVKLDQLDVNHLITFDGDETYTYNNLYLFDAYARVIVNKVPLNDPATFRDVENFLLKYAPSEPQKNYWVSRLIRCKLPKYLDQQDDGDDSNDE